ncbi:MAG: hypothetical protein ACYCYK_05965 [Candidatus Dormibacteria bacterium]
MATEISVRATPTRDGFSCRVEIKEARGRSSHLVRVTEDELRRYGRGRGVEELVTASFWFLLEREPPSSILAAFDLSTIGRYFPEFEERI